MRSDGGGIRVGGSWGGPGTRFGRFGMGLGGSWGGLGGSGAAFWGSVALLGANTAEKSDKRANKSRLRQCCSPSWRGKMAPRDAQREPSGRQKGAQGHQNGAQEVAKWIKNASEAKMKICKKCRRVVQKSMLGSLKVKLEGRKNEKKLHREM